MPCDSSSKNFNGPLSITEHLTKNQLRLFDLAWCSSVQLHDRVLFGGDPNILNAFHLLMGEELTDSDLDFAASIVEEMSSSARVKFITHFTKTLRPLPFFEQRFKAVHRKIIPLIINAFKDPSEVKYDGLWTPHIRIRNHWNPCGHFISDGEYVVDIDFLPVNADRVLKKETRIDIQEVKHIQHGLSEFTGWAEFPDGKATSVNFLAFHCELKKV